MYLVQTKQLKYEEVMSVVAKPNFLVAFLASMGLTSPLALACSLALAQEPSAWMPPEPQPDCLAFYRDRYHRSYRVEKKVKNALYATGAFAYAGGAFVLDGLYAVGGAASITGWAIDTIERNQKAFSLLEEAHDASETRSLEEILNNPDSVFYGFFYKQLGRASEIADVLEKSLYENAEGPCQTDANGKIKFMTAREMRRYALRSLGLSRRERADVKINSN
jgi:hypothetical protein